MFILNAALLALFINCSPDHVAGGTSTSENGRIAGIIFTGKSEAASRTLVTLVPAAFNPLHDTASLQTDTTDSSGRYSFTVDTAGTFALQCVHLDSRTRAAIWGIHVKNDTILVPSDTLKIPGSVRIALFENTSATSGHVFIPGSTLSAALTDSQPVVILDSVPAGTIPSIVYESGSNAPATIIQSAVNVQSGESSTLHLSGWKYIQKITLNTTASGAAVSESVHDFPLLVRLSRDNFDFSEAAPDGSDIRFTKQSGVPVHFEIEEWNSTLRQAVLWIKIDTLYGNNNDQSILMYWGNPDASSPVTARSVFDTANGFAGVWHMDEASDTLFDATANNYRGVKIGTCRQSDGIIGKAAWFDTAVSYAEMGNILNFASGSFTISAWVKRSGTGLQTIFAKSNGGNPSADYGWTLSFGQVDQLHFFVASGGSSWGNTGTFDFWAHEDSVVTDSVEWHFVAAVFDRRSINGCKTILDGINVSGGFNGDVVNLGNITNKVPLRIGAEADGNYQWTGGIDECVISSVVRSDAWLRLCYVNQQQNDLLVDFEQ